MRTPAKTERELREQLTAAQAEIERLKGFERIANMSGQNIGLRLMDAETENADLRAQLARVQKRLIERHKHWDGYFQQWGIEEARGIRDELMFHLSALSGGDDEL